MDTLPASVSGDLSEIRVVLQTPALAWQRFFRACSPRSKSTKNDKKSTISKKSPPKKSILKTSLFYLKKWPKKVIFFGNRRNSTIEIVPVDEEKVLQNVDFRRCECFATKNVFLFETGFDRRYQFWKIPAITAPIKKRAEKMTEKRR